MSVALCVVMGCVGGLVNSLISEMYTSINFLPVQDLASASTSGAVFNLLFGLSLGYNSCVPFALSSALVVYISYYCAGLYGISIACVGMLSPLASIVAVGAFAPPCDNVTTN